MTHAMFCAGAPDPFRSLEGGAFDQLDQHLAWVREHYPQVEFATATEALLEYLDYYTPTLDTYTSAPLIGWRSGTGHYEFACGCWVPGFAWMKHRPATVRIAAPPCFYAGRLQAPAGLAGLAAHRPGRTLRRALSARGHRHIGQPLSSATRGLLRPEAVAAERLPGFRTTAGSPFTNRPNTLSPICSECVRPSSRAQACASLAMW